MMILENVGPLICLCLLATTVSGLQWPELPEKNGEVDIPAQRSPYYGERTVRVYICYPAGTVASVNAETGLFLSLHNWGGKKASGAPDPGILASRFNTVAVSVDYLQSGLGSPPADGNPYDCGYLQALDALRALYYVYSGLKKEDILFDEHRMYSTGGSGGGNVTLMANKLAPRTFACIVDLSGPAYLSDDIAFGLPGGSRVNAGYSRDPRSPNYLSKNEQQIRDTGHATHATLMKKLGNRCRVVVCHGMDDASCSASDKKRAVANMEAAGLEVDAHYITKDDVDGTLLRNSGHSVGNRTSLLTHFAGRYLSPDSKEMRRTTGRCDFELRDDKVSYETDTGRYVISYKHGYPVGSFVPADE